MKEIPAVWRRVVVPGRTFCEALHYVTQYTMGRQSCHLLKFSSSDDPTYCTNNLEGIDEYEYLRENPDGVRDRWDEQILAHPALASSIKIENMAGKQDRAIGV
jgi:hypothetical protein